MNPTLSLADQFAAELAAATPSIISSASGSFKNAKWPLFSIPPLTIYLQGLRPIDWTLDGRALVQSAIQAATATRRGPGRGLPFTPTQLEIATCIAADKHLLYSALSWHKEAVAALVESGLTIHKERVASLTTTLATITAYKADLLEFLSLPPDAEGSTINKALAEAMAPISAVSKPLTTLELAQALDDL